MRGCAGDRLKEGKEYIESVYRSMEYKQAL
jgi:hypothetical protein